MKSKDKFLHHVSTIFLLCVLAFTTLVGQSLESVQAAPPPPLPEKQDNSSEFAPVAPTLEPKTDNFGYILTDSSAPVWVDATSGTRLVFESYDEGVVGPVSLGFNFPFYENVYSEIYVNPNGQIMFGEGSSNFSNRFIPRDSYPDNFLAPLWDDLILYRDQDGNQIGHVYTKAGSDARGKFFAVEWYKAAPLATSENLLTFEALLYENGDIVFQYLTLTGVMDTATVGIEDGHGVDGLLYLLNSPGLSTEKALTFTRPAKKARAKFFPLFTSAFAYRYHASMQVSLVNSGELGPDSYRLKLTSDDPDFSQVAISYRTSAGNLSDSNGDGYFETPTLAQGETLTLTVLVQANKDIASGDTLPGILSAISVKNPQHKAVANVQLSVPVPFAQAMFDSSTGQPGLYLQLVGRDALLKPRMPDSAFTGSNFSLYRLMDGTYMFSWEKNKSKNGISYTDLQYVLVDRLGGIERNVTDLTNNGANLTYTVEDRYMMAVDLPNGNIGTIWLREGKRALTGQQNQYEFNQNIYFAIFNRQGALVLQPTNITQNTAWGPKGGLNVPSLYTPRISIASNRFIMAWVNRTQVGQGVTRTDIWTAVYDASGKVIKSPVVLTDSAATGLAFQEPALLSLSSGTTILAYVSWDQKNPETDVDDINDLVYVVLNQNGGVLKNQALLSNNVSTAMDCIQLTDEQVLLTWNRDDSEQIQYVILDSATFGITFGPQMLETPKNRNPGTVSVTKDRSGRAVLTWADQDESQYLFYALVKDDGTLLTPPMIFSQVSGRAEQITMNEYGASNAAFDQTWQVFSPVLYRR